MTERPDLDRTDFAIVAALQNDARLSNKELAARVGLAPSSCLVRVRRLRELGIITGFQTLVDPAAVGVGIQAMTAVRLSPHTKDVFVGFRAHCLALPEVVALYQLAGDEDFLVHSAVRDTEHLRQLTEDLTSFGQTAHISTALIFEAVRRPLPVYAVTAPPRPT
jgi:DNA-binding Lrp family transcriptional regulator